MLTKKIMISQSNYIPWKGYFDSLHKVDEFIIYDDMQYTKRDWRNRNLIKTPQGLKWLSIPVDVKGKYFQKINETKVLNNKWIEDHLNQIKQNYKQASYFSEFFPWLEEMYLKCEFDLLTEINQYFIENICSFLGVNVKVLRSEKFELAEDRTERLLNICLELGATDYFSGLAAKSYMNEIIFEKKEINIHYFDHNDYKEYPQLHGDFEHGVSIIDLILNTGKQSTDFFQKQVAI